MVGPRPLLSASRAYTSASTVRAAARPSMPDRPTKAPRSSFTIAVRLMLMMLPLVAAVMVPFSPSGMDLLTYSPSSLTASKAPKLPVR